MTDSESSRHLDHKRAQERRNPNIFAAAVSLTLTLEIKHFTVLSPLSDNVRVVFDASELRYSRPPTQPVFGPAHTITGAHSKHPNTTPTRDSVRVATVPFAFSTWRYSPSTYSEKSRSPVTNHGQTTPMLGFSPVYRYPYGTSKPQTRPVDAISPFSNMAHSAPRRVA